MSIPPTVHAVILLFIYLTGYTQGQYRRVCYYTNWAQYRPAEGKYFPEDVDPSLCSHIIYAFAKLNGNRLVAFEWNDESTEWMKGMYARYNEIKIQNPEVKTLLAVGGWNMASAPFTKMVATAASRREFATSTIPFLRERNFDGVDIDWEYPANRGSPPEDRDRYTALVREVRRAFDDEARRTGRPPLLLTSAVAAGKSKIDSAYDIPQVCRDMDFISLMAYDLHGSWENTTGHNSPLYAHAGETGDQRFLNMDWASNYWVQMGCPKEKLVIGMGLYGRSFTLADRYNNGLMAPVKGKGEPGKYTREGGFLAYYEVCDMLTKGGQSYYMKEQEAPYCVLNDQWVGYDDVDSLRLKVQWMKLNGFSGVMVWALDLDDFKGWCGQGKYPLLNAINQELNGGFIAPVKSRPDRNMQATNRNNHPYNQNQNKQAPPPPPQRRPRPQQKPAPAPAIKPVPQPAWNPPPPPSVRVTQKPTTTPKKNLPHLTKEFNCPSSTSSYFPSTASCDEYYICASGLSFKFKCAAPLRWNPDQNFCDWPHNVQCDPATRAAATAIAAAKAVATPPKWRPTRPPTTTRRPTTTPRPTTTTTRATTPATPPPWMNWSLWIAEFWKALASMSATPGSWMHQNNPNAVQNLNRQNPLLPNAIFPNGIPNGIPTTNARPAPKKLPFCTGKTDGIHPDPSDCTKYIDCVGGLDYKGSCPARTAFDTNSRVCDYINKVPRCAVQMG